METQEDSRMAQDVPGNGPNSTLRNVPAWLRLGPDPTLDPAWWEDRWKRHRLEHSGAHRCHVCRALRSGHWAALRLRGL